MPIIWVNQHASLVVDAEHCIANTARHLSLARAIDLLASSPALVRNMGKAARNRYHEYFRPEHHTDRLLGVFNGLLQNRGMS